MKFKQLLTDDDAVSPVIGVILMVAITVILAAVIASFVLGLGSSADEVQPNSSFSFNYDGGADTLTITLTDGDNIDPNELFLRGNVDVAARLAGSNGIAADDSWQDLLDGTASASGDVSSVGGLVSGGSVADEVSSGQGIEIDMSSSDGPSYEVNVIWETAEDSATLETSEGPEA